MADVEEDGKRDRSGGLLRKAETTSERHAASSRFFEGFVDQHDRDVAHDRIDAVTLGALKSLLDHRLLAAELVTELVAHGGASCLRKRYQFDLDLAEGTGQDLEKFRVNCHAARSVASSEEPDGRLPRIAFGLE